MRCFNKPTLVAEALKPKTNRSSSQARAKRAVLLLIFFKAAPVFGSLVRLQQTQRDRIPIGEGHPPPSGCLNWGVTPKQCDKLH